MAFTIVTNGWQPDAQLIESAAAVRSDHEVACRRRANETVLGDSYLSGEHGVSASLTARVTKSIDGCPQFRDEPAKPGR